MIFERSLTESAADTLALCRRKRLLLSTAESCTGGMIATLLTSIAGSSDVLDAGFVTYSNEAKTRMLGIPAELISQHGAVSAEVARAMANGAIARSRAELSVAVTGVAGPAGGSSEKPVGLVYVAAARKGHEPQFRRLMLGNIGRERIRLASTEAALLLVRDQAALGP